jgi:urease accessory protein
MKGMSRQIARALALGSALAVCAGSAQAHHAMGGALPSTFAEGFISGLAHPVIGLDHLAFLVAAGVAAGVAGLGVWMPVLFVAASVAGAIVHLQALDLPAVELAVGASVVLAGAILALGRLALGRAGWAGLFIVAGLFHGYAYGEAIVGAEPTPVAAYIAGLAIVQSAIGVAVALLAARRDWTVSALAPRLAGAAVFGIGLSALAGQLIPG